VLWIRGTIRRGEVALNGSEGAILAEWEQSVHRGDEGTRVEAGEIRVGGSDEFGQRLPPA
jgi:hypothetical protein